MSLPLERRCAQIHTHTQEIRVLGLVSWVGETGHITKSALTALGYRMLEMENDLVSGWIRVHGTLFCTRGKGSDKSLHAPGRSSPCHFEQLQVTLPFCFLSNIKNICVYGCFPDKNAKEKIG